MAPRKVQRNASRKSRKAGKNHFDSSVWRVPNQPPETSASTLSFTLQGNLASMGMTFANDWTLTYPEVTDAVATAFGFKSGSLAVRITSYACYGPTSSPSTGTVPGIPYIVILEDAFTGRQVRSTSTPLVRCRAGIVLPTVRQMKWYDEANRDTVAEKHICYLRMTDGAVCLPANVSDSYTMVIRGFARVSRAVGKCAEAPAPPRPAACSHKHAPSPLACLEPTSSSLDWAAEVIGDDSPLQHAWADWSRFDADVPPASAPMCGSSPSSSH